ncbi:MAG: ribbon-helix-helix protein, CopG family [Gammaproteobacteria bacterium]|nr:MAG: ribbon-helix-helix protein, CopG family [Gammaproteobacteria bacterium]
MTADAYITCRVSSEAKARVRALARREGISESALVRQLLEVVLRTSLGDNWLRRG